MAQLAGQDDLGEAHLGQEAGLLRGADVALGGGVQVDGREVQLQQPQVLDDEGVHAGVVEVLDQAAGGLQLVVVEDGVEGDVDAGVEAVGVLHQAGDLRHRVVRIVAGAEGRAADVDGVSRSHGPPWECCSRRSAVQRRAAALAISRSVGRSGIAVAVGMCATPVRWEMGSVPDVARRRKRLCPGGREWRFAPLHRGAVRDASPCGASEPRVPCKAVRRRDACTEEYGSRPLGVRLGTRSADPPGRRPKGDSGPQGAEQGGRASPQVVGGTPISKGIEQDGRASPQAVCDL